MCAAMFPEYSNHLLDLGKRYVFPVLYGLLLAGFFLLFKKWGLISLILVLVPFYGLLIFLAFMGQKLLIFCPVREIEATPADLQLPYEPLQLSTPDGETLHAWFVPGDQNRPVVLFCHGNNSNISSPSHLKFLELLHSLGLSTIIFDYRGFGRSSGSPDQAGTYRDGEAVWKHLVQSRGYTGRDILIWGKSLGGGIASYLASQHQDCRALVLEATFTSIPDVARRLFPILPVKWIVRHEYPVHRHVSKVDSPVLVMHSPEDETIPYRLGRRVFEAAREPKKFVQLSGGHVWGFWTSKETCVQAIKENLLNRQERGR
ncbi:MAG: alpha/beta hydrolase [Thermodesulfobacteriota bacterium]